MMQGHTPWQVLSSTSGGNQPVAIMAGSTSSIQLVQAATSGGAILALTQHLVVASQIAALADGSVVVGAVDTKRRPIVTLQQVRQLVTCKYLQVTTTGEAVLLAGTSGTYHDLLSLFISPATSNAVRSICIVRDSSGGATQLRINVPAGTADQVNELGPFTPPWKHSTATSTGSAWTVTFVTAGTYDVMAQFSDWTS